jgi:AraC-like DNA-binding protein
LARHAKVSRYHLHRLFKTVTGVTPKAYAAAHRGKRVRAGLEAGGTVTEALYDAGYGSGGRFYAESDRCSDDAERFRAGGAGDRDPLRDRASARSARSSSPAANAGVCAIELGDDPETLARRLQDRFPHATWRRRRCPVRALGRGGRRLRRGAPDRLALPLDVRGTAFQQRVWQALQGDPAGADRELRRDRRAPRGADRVARSGPGLRRKSAGRRDPDAIAWSAATVRSRAIGGASTASARCWPARQSNERSRRRACRGARRCRRPRRGGRLDGVGADLDAQGAALIERLLTPDECRQLAALYPRDDLFRSTRDDGAARLRTRRVPLLRLSAAAADRRPSGRPLSAAWRRSRTDGTTRWASRRGFRTRLADFTARCHAAGQRRPTPLLLRYGEGDYNCLHQDLYGDHVFPLQVVMLLSKPGRDFAGGEFVMTEQRPRMQSRPLVVPLDRGDAR